MPFTTDPIKAKALRTKLMNLTLADQDELIFYVEDLDGNVIQARLYDVEEVTKVSSPTLDVVKINLYEEG